MIVADGGGFDIAHTSISHRAPNRPGVRFDAHRLEAHLAIQWKRGGVVEGIRVQAHACRAGDVPCRKYRGT